MRFAKKVERSQSNSSGIEKNSPHRALEPFSIAIVLSIAGKRRFTPLSSKDGEFASLFYEELC